MLRFLTAGESHGQALVAIVDGLPAGLALSREEIDRQLRRRQAGYGRGRRMAIESDAVEILSGVRHGVTIGSPVALLIRNKDWVNWQWTMAVDEDPPASAGGARRAPVTRPRPGHADLAGAIKYGHADLRNVLERASARETAARVAAGAVRPDPARAARHPDRIPRDGDRRVRADRRQPSPFAAIAAIADDERVRCEDPALAERMMAAIDEAKAAGDTLGGTFEVVANGVPPGLGSYVQWDRRLDARLAQALMSIPAVKAVEIGDGVAAASLPGSQVHDAILPAADAGAARAAGPPDEPCRRPGRRRHQRRRCARHRLPEADRHADVAAALGGPSHRAGCPGRDRTQRHVRGAGRRRHRRGGRRARAGRGAARDVRRRHGRRDRAQPGSARQALVNRFSRRGAAGGTGAPLPR